MAKATVRKQPEAQAGVTAAKKAPALAQLAAGARAPTAFELRLHKVCCAIPKGKVSTYGALSAVLKSSPRAVGQALRRNPYAPRVPCHRVVASTLELGGFNGTWGEASPEVVRKRKMLVEEGVRFEGRHVKPTCVIDPGVLAGLCPGM